MTRTHKSQIREILLQLTDLQNRLNTTYWNMGENISTSEEIAMKRALDSLKTTIKHLTGAI